MPAKTNGEQFFSKKPMELDDHVDIKVESSPMLNKNIIPPSKKSWSSKELLKIFNFILLATILRLKWT